MSFLPAAEQFVTLSGGLACGPSWRRGDDGGWLLPSLTLGWDVLDWCHENLLTPDGELAGQPWMFTPEQARLVLWWYAIDERGRFLYRDGSIRRLKGWGKDPFGAALSCVEFLGPCRFDGFDATGSPLVRPSHAPWVQISGVSEDATKNTTEALRPMLGGRAGARRLGVELGKEVSYSPRGRLEVVTSSPSTLEGNRPSFVLRGEVHLWTPAKKGKELAAVIQRNLAKNADGSARGLSITNAPNIGSGSVGEDDHRLWEAISAGRTVKADYMYDSLEAPPGTDFGSVDDLRRAVGVAAGDSWWIPVDRVVDEILDPRATVSESRRFYLNQLAAPDDALFEPHNWAACVVDDSLAVGDEVALFFDGSSSDDHTGLVACRVADGLVQPLGHWNPASFGGQVPRDLVDAAVAAAFDMFHPIGFWADLRMWESYVDSWANMYGSVLKVWPGAKSGRHAHPVAFDMRGRLREFSEATERFVTDVLDGSLTHTGHPALAQHVSACRRSVNRYGFSVRKASREGAGDKIDLAVCAIGARMVRRQIFFGGVGGHKSLGRGFAF